MDEHTDLVQELLDQGPASPLLPEPVERRRLREEWGKPLSEIADALGTEWGEMLAWETGEWDPAPEDSRAYYRLLHGFRYQMPAKYEPDYAALRRPTTGPGRNQPCPRCAYRAPHPTPQRPALQTAPEDTPAPAPAAANLLLQSDRGPRKLILTSTQDTPQNPQGGEVALTVTAATSTNDSAVILEGHVNSTDLHALAQLLQQAADALAAPPAAAPRRDRRPCTGQCRPPHDSDSDACIHCDSWLCVTCRAAPVESTPELCGRCVARDEGLDDELPHETEPPHHAPPSATASPRSSAAKRHHRWTAQDREHLLARHQEGAPPPQIARELERSPTAIRWQLFQLGAGPRPAVPRQHTPRTAPPPAEPPF